MSSLIGIPFVNGGRDFSGADCYGVAQLAFKALYGIEIPEVKVCCDDSVGVDQIVGVEIESRWEEVELNECMGAGPILLVFANKRSLPDLATHVGTWLGTGRFLHTLRKQSSVAVSFDDYWKKRFLGAYRLRSQGSAPNPA